MDSLIEPSPVTGLAPDTISISNVNLSLGSGAARVHILKDISLRVARGEAIGLIGPSGSGKSTLLMVMAGLERPDSGEVVVGGTPFNALDEDALARFRGRQVGIVFQSFHLIPTMTALENVAVPLELAGDAQRPAGRLLQPRQQHEERGLARTRRPDQADRLAAPDGQVDSAENVDLACRPRHPEPQVPGCDERIGFVVYGQGSGVACDGVHGAVGFPGCRWIWPSGRAGNSPRRYRSVSVGLRRPAGAAAGAR